MDDIKKEFSFTKEGYLEAVSYLKEIGEFHLIEKEVSTDGYTLVELANNIWQKNNQNITQ